MPLLPYKNFEPEIKEDVFIAPNAYLIGNVRVSSRASIWFGAVIRGDMDEISIGEESNIQDNVTIHVDFGTPTRIGRRVTVGHNAVLHGAIVADGVLIGMGSVILNGAVIGKDSLIAAGSLITPGTEIPPRSLVMGSPGKVVKSLEEEQLPVKAKMYRNYLDLAKDYRESESA
ncbi:MAG: gamma carbonic anhydrase family protein [Bacillota bacterium]